MNGDEQTSIVIICVNYRNDEDTIAYVSQLLAQKCAASLTIRVVDNSERPPSDTLSSSCGRDPRVRLLVPPRNLGYFGGARWALDGLSRDAPMPHVVVVSNTDLVLPSDRVLDAIVEADRAHPQAGVIAPSIRSMATGRDANPYMVERPSRARMQAYKTIFSSRPTSLLYHALSASVARLRARESGRENGGRPTTRREIYAPHGSFVMFRRRFFTEGGTLAHGSFLFGEEITVAETARRLGLAVVYEPTITLLHRGGTTTSVFRNRATLEYMKDASAFCADTYFR